MRELKFTQNTRAYLMSLLGMLALTLLASCGGLIMGDPGYGGNGGGVSQLPENEMRVERINFRSGSNSATVQGNIRGSQSVDYLVSMRAGEYLNVGMATNSGAYFNIMEPGEMYQAIYNGSNSGRQFEGRANRSGDYRIRVYQMGNAADSGQWADYRLEVIRASGNSGPSSGTGGDNFQASGRILCSLGDGVSRQCEFGVVRRSPGDADVTVFRTNGSRRIIYFQNGQAVGYDQSQADRGRFRVSKVGDIYVVRIGNERYEIPEAVVFGG